MVPDSGKTPHTGTGKPLNTPEPVCVEEKDNVPVAVRLSRRQLISAIDDRWRIDDEWWRSQPVSRLYYAIRLSSGQRLVIYKDMVNQSWYRQPY